MSVRIVEYCDSKFLFLLISFSDGILSCPEISIIVER